MVSFFWSCVHMARLFPPASRFHYSTCKDNFLLPHDRQCSVLFVTLSGSDILARGMLHSRGTKNLGYRDRIQMLFGKSPTGARADCDTLLPLSRARLARIKMLRPIAGAGPLEKRRNKKVHIIAAGACFVCGVCGVYTRTG